MWGGVLGLPYVENERWGGLILTLLLSTFGVALAFPLSILLALGRRSDMPVIRALCVGYIELIRGVPHLGAVHGLGDAAALPAFGSDHRQDGARSSPSVMFAAAYLAEVVRGGLQAFRAASTTPRTRWRCRTGGAPGSSSCRRRCASVPPLVNTFIALSRILRWC